MPEIEILLNNSAPLNLTAKSGASAVQLTVSILPLMQAQEVEAAALVVEFEQDSWFELTDNLSFVARSLPEIEFQP